MPPSTSSPSSSSLRHLPQQVADGLVLPHPSPMPKPIRLSYNVSTRKLATRPRPRPTVASIADVFVGSLVLASFCQEHSPRCRGLSTMCVKAPEYKMRRFRGNDMSGRMQLPSKKRLEYTMSAENFSPARRFMSNGLKHADEPLTDEDGRNHKSEEKTEPDSNGARGNSSKSDEFEEHPSSKESSHEDKWVQPDKKLYRSISNLYRTTFNLGLDWKEAADIVAFPQKSMRTTKDHSHDAVEIPSVAKLVETLRSNQQPSTQYLFRLYRSIPAPGVAHLSKKSRGALLRRFAAPRDRRWVDARRFLALVDDMITAGLPMSRTIWSSAIHFAGRAKGQVARRDLVRAIGIWQQMEHVAGIPADDVVFNILFDIAIKAGQFTVADRLQEEMVKRNISFSRCGKVSKIYYYGLRHDLNGIRDQFDEFVRSGELVDTVVLNCLTASFLRAGDVQTAEQLYARMLEAYDRQRNATPIPDQTSITNPTLSSEFAIYRARTRSLGRILKKSQALKNRLPEYHRALQDSLPMTPDTRTFYTFLRYYAYHSGELDSFMAVLRDMEYFYTVPPRPLIYLLLFEGFSRFGRRNKAWSAEKLRLTWHTYLRALRDSKTRQNKTYTTPPKEVWENPLSGDGTEESTQEETSRAKATDDLYMPLPSVDADGNLVIHEEPDNTAVDTTHRDTDPRASEETEHDDDADAKYEDFDLNEFFNDNRSPSLRRELEEMEKFEEVDYRVENGVFLGRRMVIVILRAFGTCCGPKEVLEAWLQLERLWHPDRRKFNDVLAVREELDKQMSRK
ncbi:hypothetical protein N7510_007109 [Penicillium lagena]|uniref:uncharacterized protein n=1 Tax=Penicillium lagena TaxID=94218 RepID=UPI002540D085|nr:uncharacterized protein N7510_007109 [Penicillium lagena]KAJ5610390.1 hypothetical protein N7510_007109 [Penicillium lagena]